MPSDDIVSKLEKNVFAAFSLIGASSRKSTLWESDRLIRYSTDFAHPMANIVIQTKLLNKEAPRVVEEILRQYRERKHPLMWFVNPSSTPVDLAAILEENGLEEFSSSPGMALNHELIDDSIDIPDGVQLEEVVTPEALEEWSRVCSEGFQIPGEIGAMIADVSVKEGFGKQAPWRNFYAILDGQIVATSSLFICEGIAGIYCAATLPSARRKGIGTALTKMAVLEGKAAGCNWSTLQASSDGVPVYEKLGFETVSNFRRFIYKPK